MDDQKDIVPCNSSTFPTISCYNHVFQNLYFYQDIKLVINELCFVMIFKCGGIAILNILQLQFSQ